MSKLGGAEEARRLLLRQRLKGNQVAEPQASVSDSPSTVPMTQMQKQIWTVQNRHPKQSAYHIVNAWRIHGDLDLKRLEEACSQVVRRHANLRNVCGVDNGEMIMATLPENNVRLDKGSTTPEELHGVVKKFANQSFDLITGPLFRIGLWQLSKDCHVLAWVFHHIIADEHSLGVIWSDLSQAYSGRPLPEADGSFYQFVLEQNEVNQNRLSFWKGFLEKSESHLSLPADMAGASKQSFSGTIQRTEVDSSVFKRVEDYCSDNRVTPANFWLSVYALVLSKHSQQEVLRIGVPSNGRQKQSHLGAVGLGLNALPVPIQCDSDESFIEFCGQVQRNSIDAIKHQPLPPQQAIGTNESGPLFQVMLVMESSPTLSLDNVTVEFVPVDLGWSKFDMTLFVNPESATLGMEFDLHLYEHSTIQRFLDDTLSLARQALGSPNEELGTLLRPNAQECAALTGLLSNPSAYAAPVPKSIAAIAKMYPHKIGVRGPSGSLSYGDLLDRGQRLAAALRTQGVQRGDCVAVLLNADKDYVVALLGIHLAAAAYVPIDPSYPETHLDHVVKDLKTNSLRRSVVVVSNSDHIGSSSLNVEWIDISELPHEGATIQEVSPSDPAYVIYTSGSTGKPKGVVISHGALANSTQSRLDYYGGSRVYLLLSSFAFDSSVAGIFWSLASGGELVVAGSEEKIDPDSIVRLVSKHEVTHTLMLSSLWELTMNRADAGQLDSLKVVIVAGDVCHPHVVAQHFSKCPSTNLYNEYGPTEATVWTSVHRCLEADQKRSVPIGKPVGHLMPLILGDDLTLLPTGAIGELCVAGSSLATEYLGREDLTRKSFVQTEFDPQPVYRTGDLARWGADGTLRFCGRKDTQLKLRGFRIEPEEIEWAMLQHPDVREAAVALWQIDDRELLLGFYVSDDMSDTDSLKGFLRQSLPRHMVPNRLIARERLPRLSNGKLDRGALIQGMESETHTISGPAAESDAIQVAIGHIWCRLLKIEKVTSADDFFELGGDSLLGVQMLLELRRQFDLDVQISALFGASQLYQLAKLVRDASTNVTTVAPIRRQGHKPAVFCVHARTEFLLKTLPEEYPVYLVFRDLLHQGRRLKSIQEVAALYVSDLLATQSEGPYYLLGFSAGGMIAYEMANQLIQAGHQVDLIALADPPPFVNMSAWRFRLYRKLFHMRMAGGVWKQMLYLFRSGPGILGRMMSRRAGRVMNRLLLKSGKSMSLSQIEFGILQRYVQLGKTYRYPELPARCEVFVTDSHPRIVEDMRRQWRDLNGSRTTVSVINGAEKHLDLMHQSHGTDLARQFVDALVSTGGNRGQT